MSRASVSQCERSAFSLGRVLSQPAGLSAVRLFVSVVVALLHVSRRKNKIKYIYIWAVESILHGMNP